MTVPATDLPADMLPPSPAFPLISPPSKPTSSHAHPQSSDHQARHCHRRRLDHAGPSVNEASPPRFRYCLDPLFLVGCTAYALNLWFIKPRIDFEFIQYHFNDLWVIPCALPPVLWLHRLLALRPAQALPTPGEITFHLVLWSVFCEYIGPRYFMPQSGADWRDVTAYTFGALVAALWWHRHRWLPHARRLRLHEL